jgi:hypothetical protein
MRSATLFWTLSARSRACWASAGFFGNGSRASLARRFATSESSDNEPLTERIVAREGVPAIGGHTDRLRKARDFRSAELPHRIARLPDGSRRRLGHRGRMDADSQHHRSPRDELRHLDQVAEAGESDETPLILAGGVATVCAIAFLVVCGLALLAYRLA